MSEPPPKDIVQAIINPDSIPSQQEETIASLEEKNEALANDILEQRFVWILVTLVLADAFIFSHMDNWAGPIVIGALELIAVYIMADRCKVDKVAPLIDKLTGFVDKARRRDVD